MWKRIPRKEKNVKVIKRNGKEVKFDSSKIAVAVTKANQSVERP